MSRAQPLSKLLMPLARTPKGASSIDLLCAHGYARQAASGIYDLLPLGLRMQKKISEIVRRHLDAAGCSELELATLVNPELWHASGRLAPDAAADKSSEFVFTEDRRQLLAPTGEEQITTLVGNVSYRQLPLGLYQITRKFRNELRPRGGLLRTREFLMKDLYTFDVTADEAFAAYRRISATYARIFDELGLEYTVAEADSGDMGGDLSHEYHYLSESGEDTLAVCTNNRCGYAANTEKAVSRGLVVGPEDTAEIDGAVVPKGRTLSPALLREAKRQGSLAVDWRVDAEHGLPLVEPVPGEACANCGSELELKRGIEVGHTFYLGDRYTRPLKAYVSPPTGKPVPLEMGCYGIGVTRIIGAVAEKLKDARGLVWPVSIAPYKCVVVAKDRELAASVAGDLAASGIETAYDDRTTQISYAMRAGQEAGFPFTVLLARSWENDGLVEILPRIGEPQSVKLNDLAGTLQHLIAMA